MVLIFAQIVTYRKSGNIAEMVQNRYVVTRDH